MLTYPRQPICLSLSSPELGINTRIETAATLYQKSAESFHLLLNAPPNAMGWPVLEGQLGSSEIRGDTRVGLSVAQSPRLLWLEISPYRLILTMQSNGQFSYRHWFERGIYGMSRYWLQDEELAQGGQMRLRNFTRQLQLDGSPVPTRIHLDYELWANRVSLGSYSLDVKLGA